LYLWHWPLIVFVPFLLSNDLSTAMKAGVLVASLVLADLTRRLVEIPGQRWRVLHGRNRRTFLAMLVGMALVAIPSAGLILAGNERTAADVPPSTVVASECTGPQAMLPGASCPGRFGPAGNPVMGPANEYYYTPPGCVGMPELLPFGDRTATVRCDFSGGAADPLQVWIVGDSHAEQFKGPVLDLAREHGWVVTTSFGGGCPVIDVPFLGFRQQASPDDIDRCRTWSQAVQDEIVRQEPDIVFTSSAGRVQLVDDSTGRPQQEQFVDGLMRTWARWADAGSQVVALGGVPFNGEVRDPDCVLLKNDDPRACAVADGAANPPDPYLIAAQRLASDRVTAFDASPYLCADGLCYAVIGGIAAYYDADHLNLDYVRRLAPMIDAVIGAPVR
ncbi:MAG: SGNH hydrolase domain-containing protein, partial [Microbacterium sp.]